MGISPSVHATVCVDLSTNNDAKVWQRTAALAPRLNDGDDDSVTLLTVAFRITPRQLLEHVAHHKLHISLNHTISSAG